MYVNLSVICCISGLILCKVRGNGEGTKVFICIATVVLVIGHVLHFDIEACSVQIEEITGGILLLGDIVLVVVCMYNCFRELY